MIKIEKGLGLDHSKENLLPKKVSNCYVTFDRFCFICTMIVFYSSEIIENQAKLIGDECIHCSKVLRKKINDLVNITDGKGKLFNGIITQINKKEVIIELNEELESQSQGHKRSIAIAPTKNIDRFEWFLEKSTEIGITDIYPYLSARSERKVIKPERLEKIILSAMKQSENFHKPNLHALTSFDQIIISDFTNQSKYIAHCMDPNRELNDLYEHRNDAIVLIGPEGDFTEQEITLAKDNDWQEVSLGKSRLRTETAGIVACHLLNL